MKKSLPSIGKLNGQVVKETDLEEALIWRSQWENEVNSIFKKYNYLALPVAQVSLQ